jgi:hypothetical protein
MRRIPLDLILVVLLIPIAARATDYYISPTGSDSNSGSQSAPWATINHADTVVSPGDTVHVEDGTYSVTCSTTGYFSGAIHTQTSGTSSAHIRYISDDKWGAHLVSYGYQMSGNGIGPNATWYNQASYVDIVNFDMTGDGHIGILNDGSYVTEQANKIHDYPCPNTCNGYGGGCAGIDNSDDVPTATGDVSNANWIFNIGNMSYLCGSGGNGVYMANLYGTMENNLVYRTSGFGLQMWHHATNVTVLFNTVFACYAGVVIGGSGGSTNDYTNVSNNIFVNNTYYGMYEYGSFGTHNLYYNDLVSGNSPDVSLTNPYYNFLIGSAYPASAVFVNWQPDGSGNYHLKSGSPAIGAADASYPVSPDFDGVTRPQGTSYDIGCYEYVYIAPPTGVKAAGH